jgi:hypothetical protein
MKPEGKDHLEAITLDGRIILKWIFKKCYGNKDWIYLAQYRDKWQALVNVVLTLRSIKYEEFLDQLRTCYLLRKDSAPWS